MSDQQAEFNGWAKVEVMGHQSHIGFVKTEAYGAAVLFRIDSPGAPEREYILESPEYAGSTYCPAGTTVKRAERPPLSVLVGAGSIYRIIPCTEGVAMQSIEREQRSPLILVKLPEGKALPATTDDPFDSTDDSDLCMDCGKPEEDCRCEG